MILSAEEPLIVQKIGVSTMVNWTRKEGQFLKVGEDLKISPGSGFYLMNKFGFYGIALGDDGNLRGFTGTDPDHILYEIFNLQKDAKIPTKTSYYKDYLSNTGIFFIDETDKYWKTKQNIWPQEYEPLNPSEKYALFVDNKGRLCLASDDSEKRSILWDMNRDDQVTKMNILDCQYEADTIKIESMDTIELAVSKKPITNPNDVESRFVVDLEGNFNKRCYWGEAPLGYSTVDIIENGKVKIPKIMNYDDKTKKLTITSEEFNVSTFVSFCFFGFNNTNIQKYGWNDKVPIPAHKTYKFKLVAQYYNFTVNCILKVKVTFKSTKTMDILLLVRYNGQDIDESSLSLLPIEVPSNKTLKAIPLSNK